MIGDSTINISGDTDKVVIIQTKKKFYPKGTPDWVAVFQTKVAVEIIANLSGVAPKLLLLMQQATKYDNFVGLNQQTMAERLKCSISAVEKAVRELKGHGIIIPFKDRPLDSMNGDGRRNNYILNEEYCWKGRPENRAKRIKESPNQLKLLDYT
jgi:hypothetical protein